VPATRKESSIVARGVDRSRIPVTEDLQLARRHRRVVAGPLVLVAAMLASVSPALTGPGASAEAPLPEPSNPLVVAIAAVDAAGPSSRSDPETPRSTPNPRQRDDPVPAAAPPPTARPDLAGPTTDQTRLRLVRTVHGRIVPKSVVASGAGFVIAQNMMYRHSVTVYDTRGNLVHTVSDRVDLSKLGWPAFTERVSGAPVEAAFSPDGATAYVSNYSMYGPGFPKPGWDLAAPADHVDRSFVYRIDVASGAITGAAMVGSEPKFLQVSPDGRFLIVANWASWDLSIVDLATFREIRRIPVGPEPRGIAFLPDSSGAYVTTQYHSAALGYPAELYRLDVADWKLTPIRTDLGLYPRHIVLDAAGRYLYASLTGDTRVIKVDTQSGKTVGSAVTGAAPRTIALSSDGRSLYVVNYDADTLAKVNTATMQVVQRLPTGHHPVGVTFEPATHTVWVACYSGSLMLFREEPQG
jgi:YVTN family beta-propeller protein